MSVPVRGHRGGARPTSLAGPLSDSALSFTVTAGGGTGFPDGTDGVFIVTLDVELAGEEKVLCSSRSTDTFTIAVGGRGYDNTAASAHANLATVTHTNSAIEAQEANQHITDVNRDDHTQYARSTKGVESARTPGRMGKIRYSTDTDMLGFDDGVAYHDFPSKTVTDLLYLARTGIAQAAVGTSETTASAAFTDLATVGPSVTVTVPASGQVLIILSAQIYNTTAFQYAAMGWQASGVNTVAATEAEALIIYSGQANQYVSASEVILKTGLTAGATTFKTVYKAGGGTLTAQNRRILVIPC